MNLLCLLSGIINGGYISDLKCSSNTQGLFDHQYEDGATLTEWSNASLYTGSSSVPSNKVEMEINILLWHLKKAISLLILTNNYLLLTSWFHFNFTIKNK